MAEPTEKAPVIEAVLSRLSGDSRPGAIRANRCINPPIGCGGIAVEFRDEVSEHEYRISGLCQKCQDILFPPSDADESDL